MSPLARVPNNACYNSHATTCKHSMRDLVLQPVHGCGRQLGGSTPTHTTHTHNPSLRLQSKQNYARMSCRCRNEQQRQERAAEAGTCMPLLVERASVGAPNIYLAMN